jgi:hypothetical protein
LDNAFKPFEKVAIIEDRALVAVTRYFVMVASGEKEIGPGVAVFFALKDFPHMRNHCVLTDVEPLGPETIGPAGITQAGHVHDGERGVAGIDEGVGVTTAVVVANMCLNRNGEGCRKCDNKRQYFSEL